MTDAPQRLAAVERVYRVRRILHHQQPVALRQSHDAVHVAGYARIVHHHDHLRALRYQRCYRFHRHVRILLTAVGKHHPRTLAQESDGRRHKRVRGNNHLVAGLQLAQHRTHLQSIRTRRTQQALPESVTLFEKRMAALREITVARHCHRAAHLFYIVQFSTRTIGLVKGNHHRSFFFSVQK